MIERLFDTGNNRLMKMARELLKLHFHISREKKALLERHGWYANLHGGYTHPHAMDYMYRHEIASMDMERLEYALKHGSRAVFVPHK